MAYMNDEALDGGLDWVVANGSRIDICSQEPTTYAEATSTYSLGNKTGLTMGAIAAGDVDGRKVMAPAVTDGTVTGTGTVTHWALTNGAAVLVSTGALSASQAVTSGNPFTLDALQVAAIRDATAV